MTFSFKNNILLQTTRPRQRGTHYITRTYKIGFSEVLRKPRRPPSDSLLLKSRADSIGTRRRIPRSYRYLTRGAVALALVINTVLYIAANALDVVATARITVVIFHYNSTFTFPPRGIAATAIILKLFQPTVVCAVRA